MEKLGYTRQTQKLIYWLLDDFANFWQRKEADFKNDFIYIDDEPLCDEKTEKLVEEELDNIIKIIEEL